MINPQNPQKLIHFLKEKPFVLYGIGDTGRKIVQWCDLMQLEYLVSDKAAENLRKEYGNKVILPEQLVSEYADTNIIVSSMVYYDEIKSELIKLGVLKDRIHNCFMFMPAKVDWELIEDYDNPNWKLMKQRIEKLVAKGWFPQHIKSLADYGCGQRCLERYLPETAKYYPIDYKNRGEATILCDFNACQYPDIDTQFSACLGVIMYIKPVRELIEHICKHTEETILFSTITLDGFPNRELRRQFGICSDYTDAEIQELFQEFQYELKDRFDELNGNCVMSFYLFQRKE